MSFVNFLSETGWITGSLYINFMSKYKWLSVTWVGMRKILVQHKIIMELQPLITGFGVNVSYVHFNKCHKLHFGCSTWYPPRILKAYTLQYPQCSLPNVYCLIVHNKKKIIYLFTTKVRRYDIKVNKPTQNIFSSLSMSESLPFRTSALLFSRAGNVSF
jgi:hypothetical protein